MKRMIATALLVTALPASASVTYTWHNLTPFPGNGYVDKVEFSGSMVFDDATVASGHLSSDVPVEYAYGNFYAYFGLDRFDFRGTDYGNYAHPRSCSEFNTQPWNPEDAPAPHLDCGVLGEQIWGALNGYFAASLDFIGPYLRGSLNVATYEGEVVMDSGDNLWRISHWGSDNTSVACVPRGCAGMLGYWQRTVPEPFGLWILMLAGVIVMRRYL